MPAGPPGTPSDAAPDGEKHPSDRETESGDNFSHELQDLGLLPYSPAYSRRRRPGHPSDADERTPSPFLALLPILFVAVMPVVMIGMLVFKFVPFARGTLNMVVLEESFDDYTIGQPVPEGAWRRVLDDEPEEGEGAPDRPASWFGMIVDGRPNEPEVDSPALAWKAEDHGSIRHNFSRGVRISDEVLSIGLDLRLDGVPARRERRVYTIFDNQSEPAAALFVRGVTTQSETGEPQYRIGIAVPPAPVSYAPGRFTLAELHRVVVQLIASPTTWTLQLWVDPATIAQEPDATVLGWSSHTLVGIDLHGPRAAMMIDSLVVTRVLADAMSLPSSLRVRPMQPLEIVNGEGESAAPQISRSATQVVLADLSAEAVGRDLAVFELAATVTGGGADAIESVALYRNPVGDGQLHHSEPIAGATSPIGPEGSVVFALGEKGFRLSADSAQRLLIVATLAESGNGSGLVSVHLTGADTDPATPEPFVTHSGPVELPYRVGHLEIAVSSIWATGSSDGADSDDDSHSGGCAASGSPASPVGYGLVLVALLVPLAQLRRRRRWVAGAPG